MRKPLIAGNWKMHTVPSEARALVGALREQVTTADADVLVCPPFVSLATVAEVLEGSTIAWGAQNMYWEDSGAYTGEIAPAMLAALGCTYAILGHSERRELFGETDADVSRKVAAALAHQLTAIVCVGETEAQYERGETESHIRRQLRESLAGVDAADAERIVIAYEPIWAIGTGKSATGEIAERVCALIRDELGAMFGKETADRMRILYGGSVKPGNIAALMANDNIDGALVGGASLKADDFAAIVAGKEA